MAIRMSAKVVRRPSLPLTERDERALAVLSTSRAHRDALARMSDIEDATAEISESALLHAVFEIGMAAIRDAVEEAGYAAVAAAQADDAAGRRQEARRRASAWAHEQ